MNKTKISTFFRRWLLKLLLYAVCRNTGTQAADVAETDFVLFLTKIESCIILNGISNFSNENYLMELKFTSISDSKCETMFYQYSYFFRPWFLISNIMSTN